MSEQEMLSNMSVMRNDAYMMKRNGMEQESGDEDKVEQQLRALPWRIPNEGDSGNTIYRCG